MCPAKLFMFVWRIYLNLENALTALPAELSQPRELRITGSANTPRVVLLHHPGCVWPLPCSGLLCLVLPAIMHRELLCSLQVPVADELWGARRGYRRGTKVDHKPWLKGSSSMALGEFSKILSVVLKGFVQSTCFCHHWPGVHAASLMNLVFQTELEQC